jgi:hypothetical protein
MIGVSAMASVAIRFSPAAEDALVPAAALGGALASGD